MTLATAVLGKVPDHLVQCVVLELGGPGGADSLGHVAVAVVVASERSRGINCAFAQGRRGFGYVPVDLGALRMGRLMQMDGGPLTGLHAISDESLGWVEEINS